jgi:hypothetical protein
VESKSKIIMVVIMMMMMMGYECKGELLEGSAGGR